MQPPRAEGKIALDAGLGRRDGVVRMQIHLFVLDRAPFCAAPQNGAYVPKVVTWPTAPSALDLPSMLEG